MRGTTASTLIPLTLLLTSCTPASSSQNPAAIPAPPTAACFPVDGTGNWLEPQCTALAIHWGTYDECRSAVWRQDHGWGEEEVKDYIASVGEQMVDQMGENLCHRRVPRPRPTT